MRSACGFRTFKVAQIALFHTLGDLPELESPTDSAEEASFVGAGFTPALDAGGPLAIGGRG